MPRARYGQLVTTTCRPIHAAVAIGCLLVHQQAVAQQPAAPSDHRGSGDSSQALSAAGITPPSLKHFEHAPYPEQAKKQGLEGSVTLQIAIDRDGRVIGVQLRDGAGNGFDEAAVAAAERFVFEPATRNGRPIAAKILYRYDFKLEPERPVESTQVAPRLGELRGKIVAGSPPSPLAGIPLRIHQTGEVPLNVVTASDGTWQAPGLPPGDYQIEIVASGYRTVQQLEHVDANRATVVTYSLETSDETPIEVTVRGGALHREVSHYELSREELMRVPGTFGDAIHAVESMPSVARPPAFSGALIVRGSAPQDTQVFVEGTLVPRVFHYGSLSSVVPSEMIERLEFYPGNFSVRYGRGLGGIVEVGLRQTNPDAKYHGSAQIDFINTRANVEGPIPGTRHWSFMAGYRTSYVDRWLAPVLRSSGSAIDGLPRYYDYQLYLERRLPNNGVYRIGFFGANDRYVPIDDPTHSSRFEADSFGHLQSQLRLPLSSIVDFTASWSLGRNRSSTPGDNNRNFTTTYTLGTLRSALSLKTGSLGLLRFGTDLLYAPFKISAITDQPSQGGQLASRGDVATELGRFDIRGVFMRPAVYAEYELAPNRRINVTGGLRLDHAKDTKQVDVAPRLAARYVLVDGPIHSIIKSGIGLFYQPPDPAQTMPELGTSGLTSSHALHSMIGFEQSLTKQTSISVEGFEKELRNLIYTHRDGSGQSVTENSGTGRVWGVDLLLRYRPDENFFGWVSYTLSRSTRTPAVGESERLFAYDQTHVMNLLASYKLGRGWEIGGRFRYMTGFLYQSCYGGLFDNSMGAYRCYGSVDQKRLAPYHQLDLRVEKGWNFNGFRVATYLDLINTYFHNSPDYAIPNYDLSGMKPLSLSLPLLPSLGVRGEL